MHAFEVEAQQERGVEKPLPTARQQHRTRQTGVVVMVIFGILVVGFLCEKSFSSDELTRDPTGDGAATEDPATGTGAAGTVVQGGRIVATRVLAHAHTVGHELCRGHKLPEENCKDLVTACVIGTDANSPGSPVACHEAARHAPAESAPKCLEDGSYAALQCGEADANGRKDCWCVDSAGEVLVNSKSIRPGGPTESLCTALRSRCSPQSLCLQRRDEANVNDMAGTFTPRCGDDGSYSPLQCWGSTGQCWCALEDGTEIRNTRGRPGPADDETCERQRRLERPRSVCERARKQAIQNGLLGTFVPQCDSDGFYSPLQCYSSTGECWCANQNGRKLKQSGSNSKSLTAEKCSELRKEIASDQTRCEQQRDVADALLQQRRIGVFVPRCDDDGDFAPIQCHASTGQCWCVDEAGDELSGTRSRPGPMVKDVCLDLRKSCKEGVEDVCQAAPTSEGNCDLVSTSYVFNATAGKCSAFKVEGCTPGRNGFATEDKCVERCPSAPGVHDDTPAGSVACLANQKIANDMIAKGLLGVFQPKCGADDSWVPMQCSKDYGCWCVDSYGRAYAGTTHRVLDSNLDARHAACRELQTRCRPCSKSTDAKCTREMQRAGMNCIPGYCVAQPKAEATSLVSS
eukprot:TRINITY_DN34092_c0_g2_i2.p1 TRINITY_DN34092_c0_g2~~TRINITY_DN34092_c0_g2_i2.p1  ORF type:complete len:631 (-),score=102.64 TRINITY_DN34092_c0_g2_i2:65-1957(-)